MQRRDLLKATSALGFSTAGLSSVVSAEDQRSIMELDGQEKEELINTALNNDKFEKVADYFWSKGWI